MSNAPNDSVDLHAADEGDAALADLRRQLVAMMARMTERRSLLRAVGLSREDGIDAEA